MPTRAGSALPPEALAGEQGPAVTRLREAGALVLGKTVTTEFAYFDPGPTRNPHDIGHTPGGSSSGSAAAVAAGLTPFAFGSQTVGSVIRPAAFCGVVGVKPSHGRIPTDGVIPLSTSVDHVGYFTQDTDGAALAAALLCDDWRPLPAPVERPTLGVPEGPYLEQATELARDAFESHVERLSAAGYEVRRVDVFAHIDAVNERHNRLVAADAALAHHEWFEAYGDRYAPETRALIEEGMDVTASEIAAARRGRETLRERLHDAMDDRGVDVWVAPAAPGPAPEGVDDTGDPVMNLPWTHAGLPTVALPAGETDDGLPLGVQCAARFGDDEDLLRWSHGLADAL
jgi:Asp-tRNA(Asn)/Glu-tRNA(Gln) amidotransferase A subunit family amidase